MKSDFSYLVEELGVPKIIIPNEQTILSQGSIIRKQIKFGESEFLAIKSRTETWVSYEQELMGYLSGQNLEIIETVYFYKSDNCGGRYTTENWKESKVAMATNADVDSLSRNALLQAIEEKRVLFVGGWRSMGDGYVDFHICSSDNLPSFSGYYFLFDPPCYLTQDMITEMGKGLEWEQEFFYPNMKYFSRFFPFR